MNIYVFSNTHDEFYYEVLEALADIGARPVDTPEEADASLVLGGDGTVLAAARSGIKNPVVVINTGHLGFLTSSSKDVYRETLKNLIDGNYSVTRRHLLEVDLAHGAESMNGPTLLGLNDVVIATAALSKLVRVAVYVLQDNGEEELVSEYRADGLIISTPTGSTAYNLSAGGPIIHPACPAFVISPICPQALTQRPIVLPANFTLRIKPLDSTLSLNIDGQINKPLHTVKYVDIRYNSHRIVTVNPITSYFQVLRNKMAWGVKPV